MDMIFALALLLIVALSVVWSVFVRKLAKTRIKSICVIASVLLALIGTIVIKTVVIDPSFLKGTLLPLIPSLPAAVMDLVNSSDLLLEFIVGLPIALISPLIFVLLYVVFSLLTSIIYFFIIIFAGKAIKKSNEKNTPYAKARSVVWSTISATLALLVILIPVAFYGGLVDEVMGVVVSMDAIDEDTQVMVDEVSDSYINPIAGGTTMSLFRAIGGDLLIDEITSITIDGEVIYIKTELNAIFDLVGNIMPLTKDGAPGSYGEEEAESLEAAVVSLTNSKFLTTIASEAIYLLTDDMVKGEADMPMADNELLGGLITKTITIVHDDAKETNKFKADLQTVSQMAGELIKGGVFSNMDDTDALMDELAGGSTIKNVILVLGRNDSMKCLIPEVTNIGIEAIASFVEVKKDANEAYNEMLETIAADLNSVKALEGDAQVEELSKKLAEAFDHAGVSVEKENVDLYAAAMILEIASMKDGATVTADDVQAFFATNTSVNAVALQNAEAYKKITLLVFLDELVIDVDEATQLITDQNVEQEADAIGGIFSQAGTLLNDVSGDKIDIGTMAESVGGILNSLNKSVCVGQNRTSKLFIAIVQSGIVRDAASMDIATATELGIKGSTGENIDYAQTFKTISNAMDVLQNMNSKTEGGMSTEDLAGVLQELNPQTAGMIESYITEDRLANDYNLDEKQSAVAAPLISDVFGYMGDPEKTKDMSEEQYEAEAKAITDVMNLVTSASDRANNGNNSSLFGGEGDNSVLNQSAGDTVATIMSSAAIKESLNNNSGELEGAFFVTQEGDGEDNTESTQSTLSTDEKIQLETALYDYYNDANRVNNQTEEQRAEDEQALTNIGKLFGYSSTQMEGILKGDFVTPQPQPEQ